MSWKYIPIIPLLFLGTHSRIPEKSSSLDILYAAGHNDSHEPRVTRVRNAASDAGVGVPGCLVQRARIECDILGVNVAKRSPLHLITICKSP